MKSLFFAAVFLLAMLGTANADVAKDPRATARAKYAKYPVGALKIVEPVKISRGSERKDGGTVGIELIDAKDEKHSFSLYPPDGGLPVKDKPPKIILNLFVGAAHPAHKGAKMVDICGPEESALYGVLLRAIDQHKDKDAFLAKHIDYKLWKARNLWGTDSFSIHTFFHRLESHFLKE